MLPTILAAHVLLAPLLASPSSVRRMPVLSSGSAAPSPVAIVGSSVGGGILRRSSDLRWIPRAARPHASVIEVDRAALERFAAGGGGVLADVPLGRDASATLVLEPIEPFGDDSVLEMPIGLPGAGGARQVQWLPLRAHGAFLTGAVVGEPDSQAFLAVSDAGTFGFIERADRIYIISSGPRWRGLPTASYDLTSMPRGV
ncbi:MAG: hypothetical protein ACO3QC_10000, partial [Phycisphaerales bacterium]